MVFPMETSQTNRLNLLTGKSADTTLLDSAPDVSTDISVDTDSSGGGCCGGGSGGACACSSAAAPAFDLSGSRGLMAPTIDAESSDAESTDTASGDAASSAAPVRRSGIPRISVTPTEFLVTGMTCGHCVASVRDEVGAVAGVNSVEVVLKKGGASRVTVISADPVDVEAVRAAVEEAGYQLV
jgi:copper chaperone